MPSETTHTHIVLDEFGNSYSLSVSGGSGGQGTTFHVKDNPRLLVKIVNKKHDDLAFRVKEIKSLCIEDNVHIAKPISCLKNPDSGYIMRFMEDMKPLDTILSKGKDEKIEDFLFRSSSFARRYKILRKLCEIMSSLAAKGIAYCDLSPSNIYISGELNDSEVWLIDGDNLHKVGRKVYGHDLSIGTSLYWAPEVAKGEANTISSDCFSFASIVFKVLTLSTPFDGKATLDDDSIGWDKSPDDGDTDYFKLPWCGSKKNDSNHQIYGLSWGLSFTKDVYELCRKTFEEGLNNPALRPLISDWLWPLYFAERNCVPFFLKTPENNFKKILLLPFENVHENRNSWKSDVHLSSISYYRCEYTRNEFFYDENGKVTIKSVPESERTWYLTPASKSVDIYENDLFDLYSYQNERIANIYFLNGKAGLSLAKTQVGSYSIKRSVNPKNDDALLHKLSDIKLIVTKIDGAYPTFQRVISFVPVSFEDRK